MNYIITVVHDSDHQIPVANAIFKITFPKVNHSIGCCQENSLYCSSQGETDKIISTKTIGLY